MRILGPVIWSVGIGMDAQTDRYLLAIAQAHLTFGQKKTCMNK